MKKGSVGRIGTKTSREVIRALVLLGGEVVKGVKGRRGKGSHTLIRMPGIGRPVTIQDAEYDDEMLTTICRQANLDWETFASAFK